MPDNYLIVPSADMTAGRITTIANAVTATDVNLTVGNLANGVEVQVFRLSDPLVGTPVAQGGGDPVVLEGLPAQFDRVAHWDAADIGGADQSDVTSWTDSVSGIEMAQATVSARPTYIAASLGGRPGVHFDGTEWLSTLAPGPIRTAVDAGVYSMLAVVSQTVIPTGGLRSVLGGGGSGGDQFLFTMLPGKIGRYGQGMDAPWTDATNMLALGYTAATKADYPEVLADGQGGLQRLYMQGGCVQISIGAHPDFVSSDGSFAFGAINGAGGSRGNFHMHEVIFWNRMLSPAEMVQAQAYICGKYNQPLPWASAPGIVVFDGDSISANIGAGSSQNGYPYKTAQTLGQPYGTYTITAIGGQKLRRMPLDVVDEVGAIPAITGKPMVIAAFEHYNERASATAEVLGYAANYKAAVDLIPDTTLVFGTSTAHQADPDANREAYNAALVASPSTYANVLVPIHTNPLIGVSGAYANDPSYWNDAVHLGPTGQTVLADIMAPAIAATLGNA